MLPDAKNSAAVPPVPPTGSPPMTPRLPVTIVTGLADAARARLCAALARAQPPHMRVAWIRQSGVGALAPSTLNIGAGCVCCVGQAQFQASLPRLIRQGPWDHLVLELAASSHPAKVIDLLRAPAWSGVLRIARVLLAIDAQSAVHYRPEARGAHAGAQAAALIADMQLQAADQVILIHHANSDEQALDLDEMRRAVSSRAIGPPQIAQLREASSASSSIDADTRAMLALREPIAFAHKWQIVTSPDRRQSLQAQWPPELRFDRRALAPLLESTLQSLSPQHIDGVFATERAWYRWSIEGSRSRLHASEFRRHSFVSITAHDDDRHKQLLELFLHRLHQSTIDGTGCIATGL